MQALVWTAPRELVLRVDAILRRAVRGDVDAEAAEVIEVGSLVIDVPRDWRFLWLLLPAVLLL